MHSGGMEISSSGRPTAAACCASSDRLTPCMLIRSYFSVTVVISTSGSGPCCSRRVHRAIAESFPPLHERAKRATAAPSRGPRREVRRPLLGEGSQGAGRSRRLTLYLEECLEP